MENQKQRVYDALDKLGDVYKRQALKEAGFTEIKTYSNTKNHWISIVATK